MLDYDYFSVLESNRVLSRTLFFHFFSLSTIKFFASSNPPAHFFFFFLRKNQNQNQTKSKKNPKKIQNKACAGGGALFLSSTLLRPSQTLFGLSVSHTFPKKKKLEFIIRIFPISSLHTPHFAKTLQGNTRTSQ